MEKSLKDQIQQDVANALRSKDALSLTTLRMLLASIKQKEVDTRIALSEQDVMQIIEKMIKQRQESASQYELGKRPELAQKEKDEIEILKKYLPEQLSETELLTIIQQAIKDTGANSIKDIGKVMAVLKPSLQGKADMSVVSSKVKECLS